METIEEFRGEYGFLSNFYHSPFEIDNVIWPTVEHYFQAMKTVKKEDFDRIKIAKTPGDAKKLGRKVEIIPDWATRRLEVMWQGLYYKFRQNKELRKKILNTYPAVLIEGNRWGDTFWGFDLNKQIGKNVLGDYLMRLRYHFLDLQEVINNVTDDVYDWFDKRTYYQSKTYDVALKTLRDEILKDLEKKNFILLTEK